MGIERDDLLARIIEIAMRARPDATGRFRLPTERELAEQLQVQRPTLRDRLTVLETLGFVHRQQGSGTYLALPNAGFLQLYFELALKLGFIPLEQIQDAMELIGTELAANAAMRASEEDFHALDQAIERMQQSQGTEATIDAQCEFHLRLARACHNPVLVILIDALAAVIRQVLAGRVAMLAQVRGALARDIESWRALLRALQDREPELARSAMQECHALWRREAAKVSMLDLGE